jgi:hypothetical protein
MHAGSVLANDLYLFVRLTFKLLSFEKRNIEPPGKKNNFKK